MKVLSTSHLLLFLKFMEEVLWPITQAAGDQYEK